MTTSAVPHPQIVPQDHWLAERKKLLTQEKELTKYATASTPCDAGFPW
jgi:predicted dithiol-disulfide oxidoreductase (DUF899 family)